jgi:hypothetical protein
VVSEVSTIWLHLPTAWVPLVVRGRWDQGVVGEGGVMGLGRARTAVIASSRAGQVLRPVRSRVRDGRQWNWPVAGRRRKSG